MQQQELHRLSLICPNALLISLLRQYLLSVMTNPSDPNHHVYCKKWAACAAYCMQPGMLDSMPGGRLHLLLSNSTKAKADAPPKDTMTANPAD